jgi:plasmid stability protein
MAQILVRNLDERVVRRLKARARRSGRSLQAEVRTILEQTPTLDMRAALKLADKIRRSFGDRRFEDSAKLIRRERDRR